MDKNSQHQNNYNNYVSIGDSPPTSYLVFGGLGRVPDSLQIIDNITSSAPAPIDNRRTSLHALIG